MGCYQIHSSNPHTTTLCKLSSTKKPTTIFPSFLSIQSKQQIQKSNENQHPQSTNKVAETGKTYKVRFKTVGGCKLGISRYPDFQYNAQGGTGTGTGRGIGDKNTTTDNSSSGGLNDEVVFVNFDLQTLYIPPLTSATTKFLGLPLPPFLQIDIVPELFQGTINPKSGKVNLEFKAKFGFSVGSIYRAPPLQVETMLTTEESKGTIRSGKGERLDEGGRCRLVGVATVEPIDDFLMNSFLGLPTECLASLNAIISFSSSS